GFIAGLQQESPGDSYRATTRTANRFIGRSETMGNRLMVISGVILAAISLSACGTVKQQASGSAAAAAKVQVAPAQLAHAKAAYPTDLPFPQYPGSKIVVSKSAVKADPGEPREDVVLSSKDTVEPISNFYKQNLLSDGWLVESSLAPDDTLAMSAM